MSPRPLGETAARGQAATYGDVFSGNQRSCPRTFAHSLTTPAHRAFSSELWYPHNKMSKKAKKDVELFRGDDRSGVHVPQPDADPSIVRHILYLDGKGRPTPYLSTSESTEVAERFDNTRQTAVWVTLPREATEAGAGLISLTELRHLLKGEGKGAARWSGKNANLLVKRALQLAEENQEHLLDFRSLDEAEVGPLIQRIFVRR